MRIPLVAALLVTLIYFPLGKNHPGTFKADEEKKKILKQQWVDSVYQSLTDDERIAQLFMVRAHSNLGDDHVAEVEELVEKYKVGGLCFFQGTPEKQAELTNLYQSKAKVPLIVSVDAEWGLGMRLKENAISFPRQLMLGAIQDNRLLYQMGKEVANQCRRLGIHINFAPVVDVNNNPGNPVINTRSFGEDRHNVTGKSFMYAMGMQDHGVIACAKHFPGHGDTDIDSHYDLPVIPHNFQRLDSVELYPFKVLAQHGVESMMMAHLSLPALDSAKNTPSSLSSKIITGLLKEGLNYDGLIITDGLEMKGVTKYFKPGELEVIALMAGNDILLLPEDTPAALEKIKKAVADGSLPMSEIEKKAKKVLSAKYRVGLNNYKPIELENLRADLNSNESLVLKEELIRHSITLVRDPNNVVPVREVKNLNFATLAIGTTNRTPFQDMIGRYVPVDHFQTSKEISTAASSSLMNKLKSYNTVFVSLHDMDSRSSRGFGLHASSIAFIEQLQEKANVVLVVFGNPYSLKFFDNVHCVLQAYQSGDMVQTLAAQAIFGAFNISGKLPVTASSKSYYSAGLDRENLNRLQYTLPESAGMDAEVLSQIDAIALEAVSIRATPGLQVLVAKDGKVVYNKSFGYHTFNKVRPVKTDDIFDVASVTKIAAATLSVIKLHEEGKMNIYSPIGGFVDELKGSNKENLIVRDVMAHRARLKAWIPFYQETLSTSKRPDPKIYQIQNSGSYNVPVASKLYMHENYVDTVWSRIIESDLRERAGYKYSDLGFYILSKAINQVSGRPIDQYVQEEFYKPLGLTATTYNPLDKFPKSRIIPTEKDNYFRYQSLQGYVHDMGAAMLGGVSGHAGLFSTSNDIAIILQMMLNGGNYGGNNYFTQQTIDQFTARHEDATRRGIGFDMLETHPVKDPNFSTLASLKTFGHLGFTGIGAWADPEHNIIYIFMSNRTYPSMNNWKLNKEEIRPRIHDVVYKAAGLGKSEFELGAEGQGEK